MMIALAKHLTEAQEAFRYAEGLGYALPRRHVLHRWTWEAHQRYLRATDERRWKRTEMSERDVQIEDLLSAVRSGALDPKAAIQGLDVFFPEPSLLGGSIFSNEKDED